MLTYITVVPVFIFIIYQIFSIVVSRFFHTTKISFAGEKSLLASLRKKTGYTFANCKKALEIHNNDLNLAETWLRQQAQELGWSKATKLEGRRTTQGLIGVAVRDNDGVLVEVNCETDFVARNAEFQKIVEETTRTCLNYAKSQQKSQNKITKVSRYLKHFKTLRPIEMRVCRNNRNNKRFEIYIYCFKSHFILYKKRNNRELYLTVFIMGKISH